MRAPSFSLYSCPSWRLSQKSVVTGRASALSLGIHVIIIFLPKTQLLHQWLHHHSLDCWFQAGFCITWYGACHIGGSVCSGFCSNGQINLWLVLIIKIWRVFIRVWGLLKVCVCGVVDYIYCACLCCGVNSYGLDFYGIDCTHNMLYMYHYFVYESTHNILCTWVRLKLL